MNSRHLLCILIFALFAALLTGCVSQDEYNAVTKERDGANAQLLALQNELGVLKVKHGDLKISVEKTTSRLAKETKALSRFAAYFVEAEQSLGDQNKMIITGAAFITEMSKSVAEIDNAELTALWAEMLRVAAVNDVKGIAQKLFQVLDLLSKLINDDMAKLQSACQ